tara:strand:+ start:10969 stop:11082 length:114 start_codon:yes stop_codon:yes gene_type:complete
MEIAAYTIAIVLFSLGCFAMGMFVASQISDWINKKLK